MIWIFMESAEPEIKSKQASKRDRTLPMYLQLSVNVYLHFVAIIV
jgi:hypothetical protein